jgi:hypothetical protein
MAKNPGVLPNSPQRIFFTRRIAFAAVGFQRYGDGVALLICTNGLS